MANSDSSPELEP